MGNEKGRTEGLIEQGKLWIAQHLFAAIGAGVSKFVHVKTGDAPALRVFMDYSVSALFETDVYLYENPTLTGDGTPLTKYNMRRDYAGNPAFAQVFHTPTISANGTQLDLHKVPEAGQTAGLVSGVYDPDREWILKANTSYLIRAHNRGALASLGYTTVIFREGEVY